MRAKVAAIRVEQAGRDVERRRELRRRVSAYLDLAGRYTRSPQPILMITHGVAGSGKTTGSQAVVERRPAVRVRSDVERKRLVGLDAQAPSHSPIGQKLYSPEIDRQAYQRLLDIADSTLRAGFAVVIDASFLRRSDRERFRGLARRLQVPYAILDFRAGTETLRSRIAGREGDASEAGVAVLDHQLAIHEPLGKDEQAAVIAVDSESPQAAARLVAEINRPWRAPSGTSSTSAP